MRTSLEVLISLDPVLEKNSPKERDISRAAKRSESQVTAAAAAG